MRSTAPRPAASIFSATGIDRRGDCACARSGPRPSPAAPPSCAPSGNWPRSHPRYARLSRIASRRSGRRRNSSRSGLCGVHRCSRVAHVPLPVEARSGRRALRARRHTACPRGATLFLFAFDPALLLSPARIPSAVSRGASPARFPRSRRRRVSASSSRLCDAGPHAQAFSSKLQGSHRRRPRAFICLSGTVSRRRDERALASGLTMPIVSLHRSEGFGLRPRRGHGCSAKPAVGTAYSGNADFLNRRHRLSRSLHASCR